MIFINMQLCHETRLQTAGFVAAYSL